MMKNAATMRKAGILILIITLLLGVVLPVSLSWFARHSDVEVGMNSYVHKSYFESGYGTGAYQYNVSYSIVDGVEVAVRGKDGEGHDLTSWEGCAFEIKYPVQLFYFAWLQYLGYFNQPSGVGKAVSQTYFYLSADLNMAGWTLPPIGTATYPFVGNFNGNGHTISNLTIQNVKTSTTLDPAKTLNDLPVDAISGAEIVGFFGVIGSMNNDGTVNGAVENAGEFDATPGYSYTVSVNEVKNFTLDGVTVNTETSSALIGAVAGYVNGTVSNTAVSDTDIVVDTDTGVLTYTANVSDYALVGYCTNDYKFTLNVSRVTLHTPGETQNLIYKNTQGEGAGFGGSIQMKTIHERIKAAAVDPGNTQYPTAQRVVWYADGSEKSRVTTDEATGKHYGDLDNVDAGFYYVSSTITQTGYDVLMLSQATMTVTNIRYTGEGKDGYTISNADGTYYLNLNADADGLTTEGDAPTRWVYENNRIYAYSELDGAKHYLNATTALSVGTNATTTWTWSNNRFSYTDNGMTFYLQYDGVWTVVPEYYYLITDGHDNYLRYNNGLTNTTNSAQASHWTFSTLGANPGGYISTTVGNTTYYLRYDNGLTTYAGNTPAGNATSWSNNGTSLYSGSVYIRFDGSSWIAGTLGTFYAIHSGANYLNITATNGNTATLGTGTSVADFSLNGHTFWSFSITAGNPSGTISATVNGTTYYLNDNAGTLTATTANNTSWSNSGTSISNGTHYLVYDSGWKIQTVSQVAIKSGSYYLNITGTSGNNATLGTGNSVATGSVSGHTMWTVSNSGQIYAVANDNTYYLRNNSGTLSATRTNPTGWTVGASQIYNGNYYLYYSSGWKLSTSEVLGYTIDFNGNYLNLTSTSTSTNNPIGTGTNVADLSYDGHTVWTFGTTGTYPSGRMSVTINGTRYYLYGNSNTTDDRLRIATNPNNRYANWSNNNGKLQVRNRYLRYENGWHHTTTDSQNVLNFTSIKASVTIETNEVSSITVTSETEPAPSVQAGRVDSSISALTRNAVTVPVLTKDPNTTEPSAYTAFPISAKDKSPYATNADSNTGYIVSGNYESSNNKSDIRISGYAFSNLSNSVHGISSSYGKDEDEKLEVITRVNNTVNNETYSGWYRVSDGFNGENKTFTDAIKNAVPDNRRVSYTELGLKRYADARQSMSDTFKASSQSPDSKYIFGLHFMDASISKENLVTLPKAYIEGEEYENYQVPNDCIDFNVKRRGFITVFAGTYFNVQNQSNNAFFSLHEITRYEETHDIKEIKEISKIYRAAEGSDFIYEYTAASGGGYSSNAARGTLAFDMEWMTNPEASKFVMNAVYYFEIPVNGGEYALGSVKNHVGAYLFYLDIAANAGTAEDKDRVTVTEKIRDESYSVELPLGVQLVESDDAYDSLNPYEFATFALKGGFNGTYRLERTGSTVVYTEDENAELTYLGGTLTPDSGGGAYTYYPSGYVIRYLEHITDKGRDTNNYDHILIETTDTYDSSGTRTGRTVKVYADIENLEVNETVVEAALDLIVTFTYDPAGHANMKTRVVRASSEGGFNISFDQDVTIISCSVQSEAIHVNFGDNNASTLITASAAAPLSANAAIPSVDMSSAENGTPYYASVYGPNASAQPAEIATYFYNYEGSDVTVTPTTAITMSPLSPGNAAQERTLTYAVKLTPDGVPSVKVYGKRLLDAPYTYQTYVLGEAGGGNVVQSGTVTVTVSGVTIKGTSLGTTDTEITVSGS